MNDSEVMPHEFVEVEQLSLLVEPNGNHANQGEHPRGRDEMEAGNGNQQVDQQQPPADAEAEVVTPPIQSKRKSTI
ncbi:hypothetical protein LINPERPRIM_LOCUS21564 [Linum perenne]